ncbi:trigger factor [Clostridium minihomine]|uniref:trigger factor n=1 Tax=Clostridium minihomine TaxID=2045012 RepID=UPI000C76E744|nr:trigger factor [Clostridium minihomine]
MSLKSSNQVETNRYQLEVEVDADIFEKAVNQAFHKQGKRISIPGFRKGKAPRAFIEKYYGEQFFYEDAVNAVYPAALDEAVKEAQLRLVDEKIDFDVVSIGKEGLVFKATVTTWPQITIEDYKGLAVTKQPVVVADEDVDAEVQKVQERNSRMITVDGRPAQMGDAAVIDFEGFVDGVAFEGGKAENHTLDLGSGQFIPGFEEQVVGHNTGEKFDITVTFPEDYQASTLQGKEAIFKIELHEIKMKELPAVDDDFAKDVSEFDTLDAYKEDIRSKLTEAREKESQDLLESQLIDLLVERVQGEIPDAMYQNKINDDLRDFAYRLQSQGLDFNTYLKYTGMNENTIRDHFKPQAEKQVKVRLALEKIAELEKLTATEKEVEAEFEKLAKNYSMEVEKVKSFIPAADLAQDLAVEKAIQLVRDSAKVAEEKPAKEKATKEKAKKEKTAEDKE